jgi:hypothetical protein
MTESSRSQPFTWDDVTRLHQLIASRCSVDGARARMHIGDFYWALRPTADGDPLRDFTLKPQSLTLTSRRPKLAAVKP